MPVYFDVYHHFGTLVIIFVYFSTKHALYFLVYICFLHSVLHKINNCILNLLCYNCVQCIRLLSSLTAGELITFAGELTTFFHTEKQA